MHCKLKWWRTIARSLISLIKLAHKHVSCRNPKWQMPVSRHTNETSQCLSLKNATSATTLALELLYAHADTQEKVISQSILYPMLSLWNLKHRAKTLHFLLSNAMFCTMFFQKHCPPMFLTMFYKKQNIVLTMPLTVLIAHLYLLYLFIIWWLHRYRQSMQIPNEQ